MLPSRARGVSRVDDRRVLDGRVMDALAAAHDVAVQMIDTSIVRVHQHGACVSLRIGESTPQSASSPD
jgi:hypothetical protein